MTYLMLRLSWLTGPQYECLKGTAAHIRFPSNSYHPPLTLNHGATNTVSRGSFLAGEINDDERVSLTFWFLGTVSPPRVSRSLDRYPRPSLGLVGILFLM